MFDLDSKLLIEFKSVLDEIIEKAKIKKYIVLSSTDKEWVNISVLQNYLKDKCLENGLHIDKQTNGINCIIYIDG